MPHPITLRNEGAYNTPKFKAMQGRMKMSIERKRFKTFNKILGYTGHDYYICGPEVGWNKGTPNNAGEAIELLHDIGKVIGKLANFTLYSVKYLQTKIDTRCATSLEESKYRRLKNALGESEPQYIIFVLRKKEVI